MVLRILCKQIDERQIQLLDVKLKQWQKIIIVRGLLHVDGVPAAVGALAVAFSDAALVAAGASVLLLAVPLLLTSYCCSVLCIGLSDCGFI